MENDHSSHVRVTRAPEGSVYDDTRLGVVLATVKPGEEGWLARCYLSPEDVEVTPSPDRAGAEREAMSHALWLSDVFNRNRPVESDERTAP
jgi:hypothetical protein